MKLAEALILRADYQKRVEQLGHRLIQNARVQEGEKPNEDPAELQAEMTSLLVELRKLIQRVNRTNLQTAFDAERSVADALAERDLLKKERMILTDVVEHASAGHDRYSRTEIRSVSTIDVKSVLKRMDELALNYRLIDTRIQELNWLTELAE